MLPMGISSGVSDPTTQLVLAGFRPRWLPARRAMAGRDAGLYWRKPRRTNPLNPKALARAERRMAMFTRWVKHHFTLAKSMPRRKVRRRKK